MRTIWRIIDCSFKSIWWILNFIRNLTINISFIFLILFCVNRWIHTSNITQKQNLGRGALLLDITGIIVDKPSISSRLNAIGRQLFGIISDHPQENSLFYIVDMIRQAKNDHNITGIVLDLKNFSGADQPSMQYIGKALREFQDNGKPVLAIGDNYSQEQYYLASFANEIWLSPYGAIDLHGFATNYLYYKSFLNKLKVTTHVFRVGTYKSAVEPFIRDNMSPDVRKVNNHWINELWKNYLSTIAANRQISNQQVFPGAQKILEGLLRMNGDTAQYALDNKLVDALYSNSEVEKALSKRFGWSKENRRYRAISMYDYVSNKKPETGDAIAVIFANGAIINGKKIIGNVSSDATAKQIRNARFDPKVKAIVLRVNSPGGSVNASEIIREELMTARQAGKPVIVSMGGIAASGGYWISTPANYIIADQSTITGSIGIFGIINTMENSLSYLGIHTDGVSTSPLADVMITKALPPEVAQMMQMSIEAGYKRFITLVAQSRKKTIEQIDRISQGHIWTGQDAKDNGLIDKLGDFDDAILKAAELAQLRQWHVNYYQDDSTFIDTIINCISNSILAICLKASREYMPIPIATTSSTIRTENNKITIFNDPQNRYALCLICTNVLC